MSVYGSYLTESVQKKNYKSTKKFDNSFDKLCDKYPFIKSEFSKIIADITDEFFKHYNKESNEKITKNEIKNNLIFKSVDLNEWNKPKVDFSLSIFAELDSSILAKIKDKHVPSIEVYFKNKKYTRNEIYFDG